MEKQIRDEEYQYYQCKNGDIFRAVRGTKFQLLQDETWVDCRGLMSFYYDAASDYWEIHNPMKKREPEPAQKKCSRCGAVLAEDYLFCHKCGADTKIHYCGACKRPLPEDANFCPYCGKKRI